LRYEITKFGEFVLIAYNYEFYKGEIEVAEMLRVDYNPVEVGKPEPLFWSEVTPVKEGDIKRTIRLMEYSRKDLLGLTSTITEECMDRLCLESCLL